MVEGIIFDFDGVIVDSEPLHWRAFCEILDPYGVSFSWEEYLQGYVGLDDRGALQKIYALMGRPLDPAVMRELIGRKAEAFQQEVARGVQAYPGILELIAKTAAELPVALCSGALRSDIIPVLESLGLQGVFPVMVTADDVAVSKPDPESYRLAFESLSRAHSGLKNPAACIAIEDTPAGIASARGAGLTVLAVTNNFPSDVLSGAHRIVSSFQGWSVADLSETVAEAMKSRF
jgi:beta-phosphoglucomutase